MCVRVVQCKEKHLYFIRTSHHISHGRIISHLSCVFVPSCICCMLPSSSLQLEKKKRRNAEKRLRLAEDSLKRLDKALRESGVKIDLEIEIDVKNLRGI